MTLPGLEPADTDTDSITLADHVDAICDAVTAAGAPVVLAVHSRTGFSGYAASDRIPEQIAAMVYVDSAPGKGALRAEMTEPEFPLPSWEDLDENLDELTEEHLARFRARAIPEPGGVMRGAAELTNDARLDVPSTVICTGFSSAEYKAYAKEGYPWLAGLTELRDLTYVDLPRRGGPSCGEVVSAETTSPPSGCAWHGRARVLWRSWLRGANLSTAAAPLRIRPET